MSLLISRDHMM